MDFPTFVDTAAVDPVVIDPNHWRAVHPAHPYSVFTADLAGAGDLNQDGVPDFVIGSPGAAVNGRAHAGEAYAVFGQKDMPQDLSLKEPFNGIRIQGEESYSRLGQDLSPAGDFNGDGALDILIRAPNYNSGGQSRAYIIYGIGSGPPPVTLYGADPLSGPVRGGTSVVLTGSGFRDVPVVHFGDQPATTVRVVSSSELLAITPPRSSPGRVDVTVTSGGVTRHLPGGFDYTPNLPSYDLTDLGNRGFVLEGDVAESRKRFTSPAIAGIDFGDLSGDGTDDLIAEATESGGAWKVFVVRGGPNLPSSLRAFEPSPLLTTLTRSALRSVSGATVSFLGDVNGQGGKDLGIGASDGLAYLFFADVDGLPAGEQDLEELADSGMAARLERSGEVEMGTMMNLVPVADLTGDGIDDFAIGLQGAPLDPQDSPTPGPGAGEILFVKGQLSWPWQVDLLTSGLVWARIHGARPGQGLAGRLKQVGDVNGDDLPDLLADSVASNGTASAFLLFLRGDLPLNANVEEYVAAGGGVRLEIRDGFRSFNWFNVAAAGDVNADSYADFLLGVEGGGGDFQGVTYLIYGGRNLPSFVAMEENPAVPDGIVRIVGEGSLEQAGRPGPAGDFNSDGHADFIIGAPGFQDFLEEAGNVFIVFGDEDLPPRLELRRLGPHGLKVDGRNILGGAGVYAGPAGDLNGDRLSDVAFSENAILDGDRAHIYVLFNAFGGAQFKRGDANFDGQVDLSDAVFILSYLFLGGSPLLCEDAGDADDKGDLNISDPVYILSHLFLGHPPPPHPFSEAGSDPTEDSLGCVGF